VIYDKCRAWIGEIVDATIAALEKSRFFPNARTVRPRGKKDGDLILSFQDEQHAGNRPVSLIGGFVSGFTLTVLPADARDE